MICDTCFYAAEASPAATVAFGALSAWIWIPLSVAWLFACAGGWIAGREMARPRMRHPYPDAAPAPVDADMVKAWKERMARKWPGLGRPPSVFDELSDRRPRCGCPGCHP